MIRYKTASTPQELEQILKLQRTNLPEAVSAQEQKTQGYVTVHHDFDILKRMNDVCPHIIAVDGDQVVGYTLCMHPKFGDEIEVLRAMFRKIREIRSTDRQTSKDDFMVMGQVCVDKKYRRQGVFRKLYETMLETIRPQFKSIITEVDVNNPRSLQAHYGIGFTLLAKYSSDSRDWELIELR